MSMKQPAGLDNWVVPDVPADLGGVEFIFILESPHKAEIRKKCPAAGTAGKAMARFLLGNREEALGEIILNGKTGNKYGIVNVCQLPMQAGAYDSSLTGEQKEVIKKLGELRNPERKSVDAALYAAILGDLKTRLAKAGPRAKLIPCGKFARKAVLNVCGQNPYEVPHPSFGNWHKKKYKAAMELLKAELAVGS